MADTDQPDPSVPSSDYKAMQPYWAQVSAILAGVEAMRGVSGYGGAVAGPAQPYANLSQIKKGNGGGAESPYLPRFPKEDPANYDFRRRNAPFTNIYSDISRSLAAKPFVKECALEETTPDDLKKLSENIDGMGHNLHMFAHTMFKGGIDKGVHYILVDYTKVPAGATLADERAMGARPYWISLPAERVIAGYSAFFGGQEIITHIRIDECAVERVGYEERTVQRVREFDREELRSVDGQVIAYAPARWRLHELVEDDKHQATWQVIDEGPVSIGIIPLVRFYTGACHGWRVEPPLTDIAHLQVELFQQESNLKTCKELTAISMLAGQGINGTDKNDVPLDITISPYTVLFSPPGMGDTASAGKWEWLKTDAANPTYLEASNDRLGERMRDLGMLPLSVPNQTIVNTANISVKAHSQIQTWALIAENALEQAWKITCMWLGQKLEPQVEIYTDFGVDMTAQTDLDTLVKCEAAGVISKLTTQEELKRRGVLSDDFDPEEEEERLAEQQQGLEPEQVIDPVTGKVVPNMAKLTVAPELPPE